ncbi:response regulator [Roseiterribacter gracilis]|uniref:Response regulatory domain-containing protein n=1 Tax=Roseiterribacter gracilis TaxID=2812848 RepID=A0A8S8XDA1_9PROT|nr:hypothetical protein TMPK1_20780 [Rhodospirillales bacterium TMPK1]
MNAAHDQDLLPHAHTKPRILVVEDEMLLVMLLEDTLSDAGFEMVFAARVDLAIAMATVEPLDGALLDVNVSGVPAFPVADVLRKRGIPFAFLTGYGRSGVRADLADAPVIGKPFDPSDIARCLTGFGTR